MTDAPVYKTMTLFNVPGNAGTPIYDAVARDLAQAWAQPAPDEEAPAPAGPDEDGAAPAEPGEGDAGAGAGEAETAAEG